MRFLTDAQGLVTDLYDYDAFGILISQADNTPNNYLYCGEQFDADLDFHPFHAGRGSGASFAQPDEESVWKDPPFHYHVLKPDYGL